MQFFRASQDAFKKAGISVEFVEVSPDVKIFKTNKKKMKKLYPEIGDAGLSLTDREVSPNLIHLCEENWNKIPTHLGSEYEDLTSYRVALISHELAHALGYDHVHCACVGCPSDVRQQPSRNLRGCKPTTRVIINPKSPFTSDNF
jgi:hypothetical protein